MQATGDITRFHLWRKHEPITHPEEQQLADLDLNSNEAHNTSQPHNSKSTEACRPAAQSPSNMPLVEANRKWDICSEVKHFLVQESSRTRTGLPASACLEMELLVRWAYLFFSLATKRFRTRTEQQFSQWSGERPDFARTCARVKCTSATIDP